MKRQNRHQKGCRLNWHQPDDAQTPTPARDRPPPPGPAPERPRPRRPAPARTPACAAGRVVGAERPAPLLRSGSRSGWRRRAPLLEKEEEEGGGRRSCGRGGPSAAVAPALGEERSGPLPGERLRSRVGGWVGARLFAPNPRGPGERPRGRLCPSGRRGRVRRGLGRGSGRREALRATAGPRAGAGRAGIGVREAGLGSRPGRAEACFRRAPARPLGLPASCAPGPGRRLCCPQPSGERPGLREAWGGGAGPARSTHSRPRWEPLRSAAEGWPGRPRPRRRRRPRAAPWVGIRVCSARGGAPGLARM